MRHLTSGKQSRCELVHCSTGQYGAEQRGAASQPGLTILVEQVLEGSTLVCTDLHQHMRHLCAF